VAGVSIPALQPEREPTRLVSVRLTDFEHLVVRALAGKEGLRNQSDRENVSAMVQLAVAFTLRHMPAGWRPENGKVLPDREHVQDLVALGPQIADAAVLELAIDGLAERITAVLQADGQTDEEIISAVARFPA
jgi:hypothetical protein